MLSGRIKLILWTGAIVLCVVLLGFVVSQFAAGGMLFKRSKVIESLKSPVEVKSWSKNGLQLADRRQIRLPGFSKLPKNSAALFEATRRGVEVAPDGNVIGLLDIHHWCGNDRVGEHIARVNLAHLLLFVDEGTHSIQFSEDAKQLMTTRRFNSLAERRWDPSDFRVFQYLSEELSKTPATVADQSVSQQKDAK